MRILILVLFVMILPSCVHPISEKDLEIERLLILGLDANKLGDYRGSVQYYTSAIDLMSKNDPMISLNDPTEPWKKLIARIKWEQGKNDALRQYSKETLEEGLALKWWCLILERKQKLILAKQCWGNYGDLERQKRVLRTQYLINEW